jgi:hypothetical protein
MNTAKRFGTETGNLKRLLVTAAENAALLPDITAERAVLEQELKSAEEAKARQDAALGEKQLATQQLWDALARAKDAGIQLQNAAKFKLGARSEKLASFQVAPLRKRGSKAKTQKLTKAQKAALLKQENEALKQEVELLRKKGEPVPVAAEPAV